MQVRPLPTELKEIAEKELYETPSKLENGIQHLNDWITKQPHLRAMTDDQWLAVFLRSCKHRLEQAKVKLDHYYSLRTTAPEIYRLRHTDRRFRDLYERGIGLVLPERTSPTAPRVVFARLKLYDPIKYTMSELIGVTLIHQQIIMLTDDPLTVAGTINVFDFEGTYMAQFLQLTPVQMKRLAVILQEAVPLRLKSVHLINTPSTFEKVFNTGKMFLNDKYKKRLFVHSKIEDLYKYVPRDILPEEYGGNGSKIQDIIDYSTELLDRFGPWLERDRQCGTDETMRVGEPKTAENMFGLHGSFRQLDFD